MSSDSANLVVTNPASRQNRRGFEQLAAELAVLADTEHVVCTDLSGLSALAAAWPAPQLLAVNGGDGTVHHLLTALHAAGHELPALALLPGGTTNMTAHDISGRRTQRQAFATLRTRLASAAGAAAPVARCALRVADLDSGDVQVGFFFGAGAIVSGIQYTHERVYRMGIADELAPGVALARVAWGMALGQRAFAGGAHVRAQLGPQGSAALAASAADTLEGDAWALLITPLNRLFLGLRPFWGDGAAPLHVTLVDCAAPRRLRNLPAILRGRPGAEVRAGHGYHSADVQELTLQLDGPYTLDGELYAAPRAGLAIRALGPLTFWPL